MKVTKAQAEKVLRAVKTQAKPWVDAGGDGPILVKDFDWAGVTAPWAVVWEGGPYDWAILFPYGGIEEEFGFRMRDVSPLVPKEVFVEAAASWALGIYPADVLVDGR